MNLNKVLLIGNLASDPEVRATSAGQKVCSFRLATNRTWVDKAGQKQTQAEFHNITAWGKQAETLATYVKKGSLLYVEGRLQTTSWADNAGVKKYKTDIVVENFQFGPKGAGAVGSFAKMQEQDDEKEEAIKDIPIIEEDNEDIDINDIPL